MVDRLNKLQQLIDYRTEEIAELDKEYKQILVKTESAVITLKELLEKDEAVRKGLSEIEITSSGYLKM